MLIVCPSCASEYAIDPARIGDGGRKVRCAICRTTWFVRTPSPPQPESPGAEEAVAERSRAPTIEALPAPPESPNRGKVRGRTAKPSRQRPHLAIAAIALVLVATPALVAFRQEVVRLFPQSGPLFAAMGLGVNLVGLDLAGVTANFVVDDGTPVLVIEGEIRSASAQTIAVPRLEFAIGNKDGEDLYRWSAKPPVVEIAPSENARFTLRLPSPPPDGVRLIASFQRAGGDRSVALR